MPAKLRTLRKYRADIGQWARGRMVELEARDPEHAYRLADKELRDGEMVVQIYDGKKCVYDYMNGFFE